MARIVVTDGNERAALAVVRSLGRAGHTVLVTSANGRSLAGASRHRSAEERVPGPLEDPGAFVEALLGIVGNWKADILIPITEASLRAVLPRRSEFAGVHIPFPEAATFEAVSDKRAVVSAARTLGIPEPTIATAESPADLIARSDLPPDSFPVVLKPSRSVVASNGVHTRTRVRYAADQEELAREAETLAPAAFPVLLQRRIIGPGLGVFLLISDGSVVAHAGHRRIREKPPSGGVSVLRESEQVPDELLERSVALLRAFEWEGVAMVEYKLDVRSGTHYLMEINGRFWGSLQLAIDAGVDFPRLLVEANDGTAVRAPPRVRPGVQSRWFWGDVDHLLARLTKSRKALGLDASECGRLGAVLAFLRACLPPVRGEVFRLGDPRPAFRESVAWVGSALRPRGGSQ